MPVFYHKTKKKWFIREIVGGKTFYCYRPEGSREAFSKKKDALAYEPVFLATLTSAEDKKSGLTCDGAGELFLRDAATRLKPSTFYGYEGVFNMYVLPFFKGMAVMEVTNAYLDTVNAAINKRKKNRYQQASVCRSFVRFLRKTNRDLDPESIRTPKNYNPDDRNYVIYTQAQFKKMLAVCECEEDRFMLTLLFYYGLRCGELLGIKWSDFDGNVLHIKRSVSRHGWGKGQTITTPKTKNSIRDYPIIEAVKPFLASLPRKGEYCFPCRSRLKTEAVTMGHSEVRRRVEKYIAKAGLPHMKVHGFRHSCVSWLLSKGMSYRTVARWVGDTESVVLETYSHLIPDEKNEIANFLDDTFNDDNE